MSFFKKLFSSKKQEPNREGKTAANFEGVSTEESFSKRYEEKGMDSSMFDGALKMIESYFLDNKIERKIESPINHPINLDQVVDDGLGFSLYCKAFNLEESQIVMFLALSFNEFMIKNYGFKLYKDLEPEFPLRTMTLKYDNQGAKLSLYPFEYTTKVLSYEASFEDLHSRIKESLNSMPTADEVYNKLMGSSENE